ncbi:ABC transporter ATP-binding protein [Pedobacter antarcticus]|uniref:ABC transporter ATP-binding protein n=1 Tax=Pedobacter antarcticus TaxID=34086 RepID=UPI00292F2327|nr:ABC transporter ATP-binding protein [Pedobacter antarcticus]
MNGLLKFKELKVFFVFLKKYWAYEVLMVLLILIGTISSLAAPFVLGKVIDDVIPASDKKMLLGLISIMIGINIIRFFVGMYSDYLNTWLSGRIITDIKEELFSNLLTMPFTYFERNKPGEVIQVISHEVDKIQRFLTTGVVRLFNNILTLLSLAALLYFLNYKLFMITLIIIPFVIFINGRISGRVRDLVKNTGIKEGELYNFYYERVKHISFIKLFNTVNYERDELAVKSKGLIQLNLQNTKLTALGSNGSSFFISLSPLIILLIGGYDVINHSMTIGALVAFIQYCNRLIQPSNDFLNLYIDYVKAHESALRIYPYLLHVPENEDGSTIVKSSHIWNIECENLSFSIDKMLILSDVNVQFVRGKSYAIVGANGAGKSTLIKMISKLYEPTSGSIKINHEHILQDLSLAEWSRYITVIMQQPNVFHESIRANLIYANRNASEDDLWSCLEAVSLKSYVQSLPNALDTLIGDGEGCANPSGGQMQKLSLARALLKTSDIILLDEVTSAMDDFSSKEILQLILKIFADKIIICITHDLFDAMLLDQVIMLEHGRFIEIGTHNDLLLSNEKYQRLFKYQATQSAI